MRCEEFELILEQEQTEPYPEAAAAHLDECESCRSLAAELSAIRMAGHELAELDAEELDAPDHVWTLLRRELEEEGIIRRPAPERVARPSWREVFGRPAFAGAALSLVLVAAGLAGYQRSLGSNPAATMHLATAHGAAFADSALEDGAAKASVPEELQSEVDETVNGLRQEDAILGNSLRHDMEVVDNSIAICEKSVREQPENEIAREYLYGAYQQKAELLDAAMSRTITGGVQ